MSDTTNGNSLFDDEKIDIERLKEDIALSEDISADEIVELLNSPDIVLIQKATMLGFNIRRYTIRKTVPVKNHVNYRNENHYSSASTASTNKQSRSLMSKIIFFLLIIGSLSVFFLFFSNQIFPTLGFDLSSIPFFSLSSNTGIDSINLYDIPWLSSVRTVNAKIKNQMGVHAPDTFYGLGPWYEYAYDDDFSKSIHHVPTYTILYRNGQYKAGGYVFDFVRFDFVATGDKGTYSETSNKDYQLASITFNFALFPYYTSSYESLYSTLLESLSEKYGQTYEPFACRSEDPSMITTAEGVAWKGEKNTLIVLRHMSVDSRSPFIDSWEDVLLEYYYDNEDYYLSKTMLTLENSK